MTEFLSGLAGEIRSAISSEQYDLGGYTEPRAKDLIISAFGKPLTAPTEMIKCTFVVGGGKLVRAKYNDDLTKWIVSALREIGYTEDRSAAETFDSQGTYKQQHDTGQNLKYLIIYPHVTCANQKQGGDNNDNNNNNNIPKIDMKSPEYIVRVCEVATLKEIVSQNVISYRQKKKLLKILQSALEEFKQIEAKLISGIQLNPIEQSIYDSNSSSDNEKITWLQSEIKDMIDTSKLTTSEKNELLLLLDTNLKSVNDEIEEAQKEKKDKKVEKLIIKKESIVTRKEFVSKITTIQHRLKFGDEIQKLRIKIFGLLALEEKGRSMSLTLADLKVLEEKSDFEKRIAELEANSRGWFETEEDFEAKCKFEEKEAKTKYNNKLKLKSNDTKKSSSSTGKTTSNSKTTTGWSTVAVKKTSTVNNNNNVKKSSSGFAAAFDSDSD